MFEGIKVSSLADIAQNTPLGSLRVYEKPDAMRTGLTAVGATAVSYTHLTLPTTPYV